MTDDKSPKCDTTATTTTADACALNAADTPASKKHKLDSGAAINTRAASSSSSGDQKSLPDDLPRTLELVRVYDLSAYYYEKGEHTSGYQSQGVTDDANLAARFAASKPMLDELGLRPNTARECYAHKDEHNNLWSARRVEKTTFK